MSPIISPASDLGRQFPGCSSLNGGDRVQNSTRQLEFERQNSREEEASESERFRDFGRGGGEYTHVFQDWSANVREEIVRGQLKSHLKS